MFEKYNLIHFDITIPLVHDRYTQFGNSVKFSADPNNSALSTPKEISDGIRGAYFRITGSFDMLLPSHWDADPCGFSGSGLRLTGFCVMNNGPDYYTRRSHHDSLLLSYTYSGKGTLVYNGKTYSLTEGTGFLIDCRNLYEYSSSDGCWEHADIHIWGEQAAGFYRCFQDLNIVTFTYPAAAYTRKLEKLLEVYTNHSSLRSLYVSNALSDILCAVLNKSEADGATDVPLVYKKIVRYMESNYMHPLSLDELAARFHVSKYHMSREFRKHTNHSPGEYLIMLRIQHASVLLAHSDLSIESISVQSGFSNMSNFIHQMKKRTGFTPSEYRKMSNSEI